MKYEQSIGGSNGRGGGAHQGRATPNRCPNYSIFMQFLPKNLQNNRLAHPLRELAPPPPRKILDPPLLSSEHSRGIYGCNSFLASVCNSEIAIMKKCMISIRFYAPCKAQVYGVILVLLCPLIDSHLFVS